MTAYENFYLPKDLTGSLAGNLITNEIQSPKLGIPRLLIPNYISFYSDSLVLIDISNPTNPIPLNSGQYQCIEMDSDNTALTGKEIMRGILITNASVGINISLTYQALGGSDNPNTSILIPAVNAATAEKSTPWSDIIDRPSEYPPSAHLTDSYNLYGFEYITGSMNRILSAIKNSKTYVQNFLSTTIGQFQNKVNTFLTNYNSNQELGFSPLIKQLYQMTISLYGNIPALQQYVVESGASLPAEITQLQTALANSNSMILGYKYYYKNFEVCEALTTYINSNITWPYDDLYSYLVTPPILALKPRIGDNYSTGVVDIMNSAVTWTANVESPVILNDSSGIPYFKLDNGFGLLNNITNVPKGYSIIILGQFNKFVGNVSGSEAFHINGTTGAGLSLVSINDLDENSGSILKATIPMPADYTAAGVTSNNLEISESITMFFTSVDNINELYNSYCSKNLLKITNANAALNTPVMTTNFGSSGNAPFGFTQVGLPNEEIQEGMTGKLYSYLVFNRVLSMIEVNTLYQFYKKYYGLTNIKMSPTSNVSASNTYTPSINPI